MESTLSSTSVLPIDRQFTSSNTGLSGAENELSEFLHRIGAIPETTIADADRRAQIADRRKKNYKNITSLLSQYRSLKRTYSTFRQEFEESLHSGNVQVEHFSAELPVFEQLSETLQIMSVTEEKKFQAIYAPHITAGRKLEKAIEAIDFGMRMLKSSNSELWSLLNEYYIEGPEKPSVVSLCRKRYTSRSACFREIEKGRKQLTRFIFGYTSNQAELESILATFCEPEGESELYDDGDEM